MRRTGIDLKQNNTEDDEFWDYSNNRIILLGKLELELASTGGKHEQKSESSEEPDPQSWDATSWGNWAYNLCRQIQGEQL